MTLLGRKNQVPHQTRISYDDLLTFTVGRTDTARNPELKWSLPAKTLCDLEWETLLAELANHCRTEWGCDTARRLPHLLELEQVERRLDECDEAAKWVTEGEPPKFGGVTDVREGLERAGLGGVLEPAVLRAVSDLARASDRITKSLRQRGDRAPLMAQIGADMRPVSWVAALIEGAVGEDGCLLDSASPYLGDLRNRVRGLDQRLRKRLEGWLTNSELEPYLQDRFFTFRQGRYVLPVRASDQHDVPGIIHGRSGSGQTLFIEPDQLVKANNELKYAQIAIEEEEQRVLAELASEVAAAAKDLSFNLVRLIYLDVTFAMGHLAREMRASRIGLTEGGGIHLLQARHPLLALRETQSQGDFRVVANDICFGTKQFENGGKVLVISGPNTGGKTVTLKTLGLFALMTRAGLLVPVEEDSTLPWFSSVFADIGDEQSIANNLSSFSAHIAHILEFLPRVTESSLVLLDELFSGTDPVQGAGLGTALLEEINRKDALVAATTHSEALKRHALSHHDFSNASMGFNLGVLKPTYELKLGLPGSSHALAVARHMGMPESILKVAEALVEGGGFSKVETLLAELEEHQQRLNQRERELVDAKLTAKQEAERYQRERERLHELALAEVDESLTSVFEMIRKAESLLKRRRRDLSAVANKPKPVSQQKLDEIGHDLRDLKTSLRESHAARDRSKTLAQRDPIVFDDVQPGQPVWVQSFKRIGTVVLVDRDRAQVTVRLGSLKTTIDANDCFQPSIAESQQIVDESKRPKPAAPRPVESEPKQQDAIPPQTPGNTLDLRGLRVDESLDELDKYLDEAFRRLEPGVYIIHGHGTGALKKAVREALRSSPCVSGFRPGERGEGGDGVTVVFL